MIKIARFVLEKEAKAIEDLIKRLDESSEKAVEILANCKSRIVLTGMGKSGIIARKISATFSSTGAPSLFLHPAEALHGDFGMIAEGDVVVALSNSGETRELLELLALIKRLDIKLISLTKPDSSLFRASDVALDVSVKEEASLVASIPTASTTASLAMGDALAVALFEKRGLKEDDFAKYHPGGQIGKKLMKVKDLMHTGNSLPIVKPSQPLKESLKIMSEKGFGMLIVADEKLRLEGILTDGDLRRFVQKRGNINDACVSDAMTKNPKTITSSESAASALHIMEQFKITSLAVVDSEKRLEGLIHLHDLWRTQLF